MRDAHQFPAELVLHRGQEFFESPGVEHVFEARLGAIGAVAVVDENPHHGIRHPGRVGRLDDDAGVAGEILMAGDAAQHEAEPDAGLDAVAVVHGDRRKADVVGILEHRDGAAAVEADIEFARNAVERAVVENVEVPFPRIGSGVEQFLRIDAGGRRAGDVADIVGTRAARAQAEIGDGLDHGHGVLRLDFAHLQVGACRHVGVAAGVTLREVGKPGQLPVRQDAIGNAQAAHIGLLRRRAVEQTEKSPAEIVVGLRCFVAGGLVFQFLVAVERMQVALEFFRIR